MKLFVIKIKLPDNSECLALLDTGSQISILREDCLHLLQNKTKEHISVKSVNKKSLYILGMGLLDFGINDQKFQQKVVVVRDVKYKLLLGMDFIQSHIKSLDIQNGSIEFKDIEKDNLTVADSALTMVDVLHEEQQVSNSLEIEDEISDNQAKRPMLGIAKVNIDKKFFTVDMATCPTQDLIVLSVSL